MKTKESSQHSILNTQSFSRRYPAEWEVQRATWLSWPHNEKEWGKDRIEGSETKGIREFFEELIIKILRFQNVNLVFANEKLLSETEKKYPSIFENTKFKCKKIIIPNNDIWIRDYGPFFLETMNGKDKKTLILDFEFNAWGGKFPPWDLDNNFPKELALYSGSEIESYPIIMEGGSLEFSGDGIIMTTEQCLLNKNRNPGLKKEQIESILKSAFNIEEIIWLNRGLEGDHTDGHIDDVARFADSRKVLICKSNDKTDGNYKHLNESIEYLKNWRSSKGDKLEVIELPMPDRMEIKNERLPNSYANFIFVNGGIIVPTFNCPSDQVALGIFKKVFPRKEIVDINCSLLIEEGGGLHCMSKQEPII